MFLQTHSSGGDGTAPYDVHLNEAFTLSEFVQWVLENRPQEWGRFSLSGGVETVGLFSYKYGEVIKDVMSESDYATIKTTRVKEVKAGGGYSNMNYVIVLEEMQKQRKQKVVEHGEGIPAVSLKGRGVAPIKKGNKKVESKGTTNQIKEGDWVVSLVRKDEKFLSDQHVTRFPGTRFQVDEVCGDSIISYFTHNGRTRYYCFKYKCNEVKLASSYYNAGGM
jgi:hypothetical protein